MSNRDIAAYLAMDMIATLYAGVLCGECDIRDVMIGWAALSRLKEI